MTQLWNNYVFRRGIQSRSLWMDLFEKRPIKIMYIAGRGFDLRSQIVMQEFVEVLKKQNIQKAELVLVSFKGYELDNDLQNLTEENAKQMLAIFNDIGTVKTIIYGEPDNDHIGPSNVLRNCVTNILKLIDDHTDIVLDVSSLPRVLFISILTGILDVLVSTKTENKNRLSACNKNFIVLVAEDSHLDASIYSEDPKNESIVIPGYSSALYAEYYRVWPMVWFPILGENRVAQLERVLKDSIQTNAEICPVLPHPSHDLRRGERLLLEYRQPLFERRQTPVTNILYVHEENPFETYRQIFNAMQRYYCSMRVLGGCRLVVSPFGSKLITVGAGLACFEMRLKQNNEDYRIAMPYLEPTRYSVNSENVRASKPTISTLLLTGSAYAQENL